MLLVGLSAAQAQTKLLLGRGGPPAPGKIILGSGGASSTGKLSLPRSVTVIYSYTLSDTARVSVGIFDGDLLVRTVSGIEKRAPGVYNLSYVWDGKDDSGSEAPNKTYRIGVLSSNLSYTWNGVIGNTSTSATGSTVWNDSEGATYGMCFANGYGYTVHGFHERHPTYYRFNTNTPQEKQIIDPEITGKAVHVCTDGSRVYYAIEGDSLRCYAVAINASDNGYVSFSSGVPSKIYLGGTYASTIGSTQMSTRTGLSGIAVQQSGSYLFMADRDHGQLKVLNKTTGALVRTLSVAGIGQIKTDGASLWMITGSTVAKYTVNGDGTLTAATLTLPAQTSPLALDVVPGGNIAVVNGGASQQVKIYSSAGALLSTVGQVVGYSTSPDVASNKFMFVNTKRWAGSNYEFQDETYPFSFIAYQPDGSYWVGDTGNYRRLHFSSANIYIEQQQNIGYFYSTATCQNNPGRLFANYLEFSRDYAKPLSPTNGSWTLTKNWAYAVNAPTDDQFYRILHVAEYAGRTYAMTRKGNVSEIIELTSSGLRYTGVQVSLSTVLQADMSLWTTAANAIGSTGSWSKRTFAGLDGSGNPQWGSAVVQATVPAVTTADPLGADGAGFYSGQVTSSGIIATYNTDNASGGRGKDWHLGGVKVGSNTWAFKAMPTTTTEYVGEMPSGGFDIGNGITYPANVMRTAGNLIIANYNGENWKNTQANIWYVWHDSGLQIGRFGVTGREGNSNSPYGMAGNTKNMGLSAVNGKLYLNHNDESFHGGIHEWEIGGLGTIQIQNTPFVKSGPLTLPAPGYASLLAGLSTNAPLPNGASGWTRSPAADDSYTVTEGGKSITKYRWRVSTGRTTWKKGDNDIYIESRPTASNVTTTVSKNLGVGSVSSWTLTGELSYPEGIGEGEMNLDVLDGSGKVLVRLAANVTTYPQAVIRANNTAIVSATSQSIENNVYRLRPLSIVRSGSNIIVSYAGYPPVTVPISDSTASLATPTTLRVQQISPAQQVHVTALANPKLFTN